MSTIEKSRERLQQDPKSPKESALAAVKDIQSLQDGVDVNGAFPRMAELMNTPEAAKTFQGISDIAQVCKGQNDAVDRKATARFCAVLDPQDASFFS